jgi:4-hydroxy-tetrahydrodipicolinate synthase
MTGDSRLPGGIIPVLQTPFDGNGALDYGDLGRLIEYAIDAGASGFLAPAVASESSRLEPGERSSIVEFVLRRIGERVPLIVAASSDSVDECRRLGNLAAETNAAAWLVAVPQSLYQDPGGVLDFFSALSEDIDLPLVVQDLQFNGPGLDLDVIYGLREQVPTLVGMKIETQPSGPKYTLLRKAMGEHFFIAGGWAVPQMIEALDRGVDAMIPESSMVKTYSRIFSLYREGRREDAIELFRRLLPILVFSNQDLATSIAFFKRLLVRRGIFKSATMRLPGFKWDEYSSRVANELIDYYLELESGLEASP